MKLYLIKNLQRKFHAFFYRFVSNPFTAELSATSTGKQPSLSAIEQSAPNSKSSAAIVRKSHVAAVIYKAKFFNKYLTQQHPTSKLKKIFFFEKTLQQTDEMKGC